LVLVIGVLGAWGKGKTMTTVAIQKEAVESWWNLGLPSRPQIVSNFLSVYMDAYIAVDPPKDLKTVTFEPSKVEGYNPAAPYVDATGKPYQPRTVPVWSFLEFLRRPRSPVPILMSLDDVYGWLASYFFGSSFNKAAFRLLAAGRKKNINIVESSVRFKDVDPRLRALHSHLFLPRFNPYSEIVTLERYLVDVFEDKRLYPDLHYSARDFYGAYDTNEVIENVYDEGAGSRVVDSRGASRVVTTKLATNSLPQVITPQVITSPGGSNVVPPPGYANGTTPVRLNHALRAPDGTRSREIGFQWQGRVADEIEKDGYSCVQGYGKEEPDIVVYEDAAHERPLKVVSVKSFFLVPYSERMAFGEDDLEAVAGAVAPFSPQEGSRGKRRQVASSGRRILRSDIEPELQAARGLAVPCELVVVNQRNGGQGRWRVSEEFEGMTVNDGDLA
jgi:hypothetical protein